MRFPETKLQKVVFWGGLVIIILMLLNPPWVMVHPDGHGGTFYGVFRGYNFILSGDPYETSARIDLPRLFIQILPIAIIIALVLWRAQNGLKKKKEAEDQET